ncbi:MAG: hypothetical protein WC243_03170 [Patescibacteria group bacterium]|jgi:hypothetical protein
MKSISDILNKKSLKGDPRNKHEFQAYGNRLAEEFGEIGRRSMYIKLAKNEDRALLEMAREYVLASEKATTRGKLFMWKLGELKKERAGNKEIE